MIAGRSLSPVQRVLATVAILLSMATGCHGTEKTDGPGCIAPANPGGGWDLSCRMTAEGLASMRALPGPMRVTNVPGRGGAVAFAKVVDEMHGDESVIVAASPSTVLGLAQSRFGERNEQSVRWIAAVAAEPSVVAVRVDAPWSNLAELVAAWRAHPDSIGTGGASVAGGQDHMKVLMLARRVGIDVRTVRYTSFSTPVEALTAVESGQVQVFPGDVSEVQSLVAAKKLRVLAILGNARVTGVLADVPTAREQGVDVTWLVWRGFYAPPGISDAAYEHWVDVLTRMAGSPYWKLLLQRNGLSPYAVTGKQFETFLHEETAAYRALSREIGVIP